MASVTPSTMRAIYRLKGTSIPVGSAITLSGSNDGAGSGQQRCSWYCLGRYWIIYAYSNAYYYTSSLNSTSWDAGTSIVGSMNARGYKYGIYWTGSYIHICYANSGNTGIYWRRGTCSTSGSISWDTLRTFSSLPATYDSYPTPTQDTDGYPWVFYFASSGSIYKPYVRKASSTDGSSWGGDTSIYTDQQYNSGGGAIHPLSSGKMVVIWGDVGGSIYKLYLKAFNGSSWDSSPTTISTTLVSYGSHASVVDTANDTVYLIYQDTSFNIKYLTWNYSTGLSSETTLDTLGAARNISMSRGDNGRIYVFYNESDRYLYCRVREANGVWRVRETIYDAGSDVDLTAVNAWISAPNAWTNTIGGVLRYGTSTYYIYYFDYYDLRTIADKCLTIKYTMAGIINNTLKLLYNIGGKITLTIKLIYTLNEYISVSKALKLIYYISEFSDVSPKSFGLKYNIRKNVRGDTYFYDDFTTSITYNMIGYFCNIIQDIDNPTLWYLCFQGEGNDPYIMTWDGRKYSSPVKIGENPIAPDQHGVPAIVQSDDGKLHVVWGAHNSAFKYSQSTNAHDISSWTSCDSKMSAETDPTYPMFFKNPSNGDLYILYRNGPAGSEYDWCYMKSTDDGANWSSVNTLFDETTGDHIYPASSGYLYIGGHHCWSFMPRFYDHSTTKSSYLHFFYFDMDDGNCYSAEGTNLGTTVTRTESNANCQVIDNYPYSMGDTSVSYSSAHGFLMVASYYTGTSTQVMRSWENSGSGWTNQATVETWSSDITGSIKLYSYGGDDYALITKDTPASGSLWVYKYNWTTHSWSSQGLAIPGWLCKDYATNGGFEQDQANPTYISGVSGAKYSFWADKGEVSTLVQSFYFIIIENGWPNLVQETKSLLAKYNISGNIAISKTLNLIYRIRNRVSASTRTYSYVLYAAGKITKTFAVSYRLGLVRQVLKLRQDTPRYYYYDKPYISGYTWGNHVTYLDHFHPSTLYAPVRSMATDSDSGCTAFVYSGVQYPINHDSDVACWKSPRIYGNQTLSSGTNQFDIILHSEQGDAGLNVIPWIYLYVDKDVAPSSHTLVKSLYSGSTNKTASTIPTSPFETTYPITCSFTLSENLTVSDKDRLCVEVWHEHQNQTKTGFVKERFWYGAGASSSVDLIGSGLAFYKPVTASSKTLKYNVRDTTDKSKLTIRWNNIEPLYKALDLRYYMLGLDWVLDTTLPARGVNCLKMIPRAEIDIPEYALDYNEKWLYTTPSIHEFYYVDDFESYESLYDATTSGGWLISESGSQFSALKTLSVAGVDLTEYTLLTFFARSDNPTGMIVNFVDNSSVTSSNLPFIIDKYWQRYEASISWGDADCEDITKIQFIASYSGIITLDDIFILNYAPETEKIHWTELNVTDLSYSRRNKFSTYRIPYRDTEIIQYSGEENAEGEFTMYNADMTQYSFVFAKQHENAKLYLRCFNFGLPIIINDFERTFKNLRTNDISAKNRIPFTEIYNYEETV